MIWQILVGVAIFVVVFASAHWVIRALATPPPPEPNPEDLEQVDIAYWCSVCGMQLTVTAVPGETKAPRHCMEEMDPV
ncbi:MAG: hypothetical protein HKN01_05485 [Acidimicrobiia bacterium]|nr:hypothetical protein [Acidimicrobiia bacterium]